MTGVVINESFKKVLKEKLCEEAQNCAEGFHNRVNSVLGLFFTPKTAAEILQRIRQGIVDNYAHIVCDPLENNTQAVNPELSAMLQKAHDIR